MIDYSEYGLQSTVLMDDLPDVLPYFTPDDMEMLGVFCDNIEDNCYGATSCEDARKWFENYKATGNPGNNYYELLYKAYSEMVSYPSDENKQKVLEFGWNPEVPLNNDIINAVSMKSRAKLKESYGITMIDLTGKEFMNEALLDTDEDDMVYYSGVAWEELNNMLELPSNNFARVIFNREKYRDDQGNYVCISYNKDYAVDKTKDYDDFILKYIQSINSKMMQLTTQFRIIEIGADQIGEKGEIKIQHSEIAGDTSYETNY